MPERPRPNLDRVREAMTDRDENVPEEEDTPREEEEPPEDDGDA
jgi:hypothetical protein